MSRLEALLTEKIQRLNVNVMGSNQPARMRR